MTFYEEGGGGCLCVYICEPRRDTVGAFMLVFFEQQF